MTVPADETLRLDGGRFERFASIDWWDQQRLGAAHVLVVGAGALGNEVIKNLALLGVGNLAVVDMDHIEASNLSRSVLFRMRDQGAAKADVAAAAAADLYPDIHVASLCGNVLGEVGLGYFRWADVVVGALDNREARVFINQVCAQVSRPWIDGGIDVLTGIVRGFDPPASACYECTMGKADWQLLDQRRSCSLLARKAAAAGGTPTTPTTASVIGAIQAQEVVKRLHGMEALSGAGYVFEGRMHDSYIVRYPVAADCPWHEAPPVIETFDGLGSDTSVASLWQRATERLGGPPDAIDLSRELVERLECPDCGTSRRIGRAIDCVTEAQAVCAACGAECVPHFIHSLDAESSGAEMTVTELGLPAWDVVFPRRGDVMIGMELTKDRPDAAMWRPA